MIKLSKVCEGEMFLYEGQKCTIDPDGKHGGGRKAVLNLETNETIMLRMVDKVEIINESPQEPEPVIDITQEEDDIDVVGGVDMPQELEEKPKPSYDRSTLEKAIEFLKNHEQG